VAKDQASAIQLTNKVNCTSRGGRSSRLSLQC
jgi:hypothetical protein